MINIDSLRAKLDSLQKAKAWLKTQPSGTKVMFEGCDCDLDKLDELERQYKNELSNALVHKRGR